MRFYLITAKDYEDAQHIQFVTSQAEAASARKELTAKDFRRADIKTTEIDIPTDKQGLMSFLNVLVKAGGDAAAVHSALTTQ